MSQRLTVVYGSEASVLSEIYTAKEELKIKIYNKNRPTVGPNEFDCRPCEFDKKLQAVFNSYQVEKIIFIGAGFTDQSTLLVSETDDSINSQVQSNIINYIKITKSLLPLMIKKRFGRLIYLSSIRSEIGGVGTTIYSGSKAFGETFFKSVGQEYGRFGIVSASIRMGYFESKMLNSYPADILEQKKRQIRLGRLGRSEDLVKAINFVVESDYINSGVIDLNGGLIFE